MDNAVLFSEAALSILRSATFDPKAVRKYDMFSGGFYWSDEALEEAGMLSDNYLDRYVINFRASLYEGDTSKRLAVWDQLRQQCPDWPGFRPERCAADLAPELEKERQRIEAELLAALDDRT